MGKTSGYLLGISAKMVIYPSKNGDFTKKQCGFTQEEWWVPHISSEWGAEMVSCSDRASVEIPDAIFLKLRCESPFLAVSRHNPINSTSAVENHQTANDTVHDTWIIMDCRKSLETQLLYFIGTYRNSLDF